MKLLAATVDGSGPGSRGWLDAGGASVLASLRKTRDGITGDNLADLLVQLIARATDTDLSGGESCALAVAHLLPVLLKCGLYNRDSSFNVL